MMDDISIPPIPNALAFRLTVTIPRSALEGGGASEEAFLVGRVLEEVGAAIKSGDVDGIAAGTFASQAIPGAQVGFRTI